MKAHSLSASKVDLAMICSYAFRPDVVHPVRPMGAPAKRGVTVHKASDCHHKGEQMPPFHDDTEALWSQLFIWLLGEERFTESEIAILYDAENDTATLCETGELGERDYLGVTAMKLPMRLDLVRNDPGEGLATVVDIKTGSKSGTEPEATNLQLATQAVAAARYFDVDRIDVGLVFPMRTKCHPPAWHTLDADALDAHAGKLRRILRQIPDSQPFVGPHCWRCPIGPAKGYMSTCPGWAQDEAAQ